MKDSIEAFSQSINYALGDPEKALGIMTYKAASLDAIQRGSDTATIWCQRYIPKKNVAGKWIWSSIGESWSEPFQP
jgi:hypothetical protein